MTTKERHVGAEKYLIGKLSAPLFWIFGFSVTFNLPFAGGMRFTDIVSVGVIVLATLFAFKIRIKKPRAASTFLAVLLFSLLLGFALLEEGSAGLFVYLRWALSMLAAWMLMGTNFVGAQWRPLLVGMALGAILATVVSLIQNSSPGSQFLMDPEAAYATFDGVYRATGLWAHSNANTAVTLLGAAAALQLSLTSKRWWMWAGVAVFIAAGCYVATQTRSGLIVFGIVSLLAVWSVRAAKHRILLYVTMGLAGTFAWFLYGDAILLRSFGHGSQDFLYSNAGERIETALTALRIVAENPIGMGIRAQREYWQYFFGFVGVHNGIIYGLLVFGWAFLVVMVPFVVHSILPFIKRDRFRTEVALVSFAMLMFLFFEDVVLSASYSAAMALVVVGAGRKSTIASAAAHGDRPSTVSPIVGTIRA